MVYVIQRSDVSSFSTESTIDPDYAQALKEAVEKGVEVFPVQVKVTPEGIWIESILEYKL